jgi:hypothetical protein
MKLICAGWYHCCTCALLVPSIHRWLHHFATSHLKDLQQLGPSDDPFDGHLIDTNALGVLGCSTTLPERVSWPEIS